MCSPTNKGALKQAGKEDDAEESSKATNGNNRAAAVSSSGHQRSGVSSSRRHHHNNHNQHKFNRSDTAVHLMSSMIQLHVAVEKLQHASPEDCWDQAFLHLVTQTNQASSRGNNSIPKSALREILKNPRVKPVVQMIKYLEDLSSDGDDGTIRKSSLDMLLTAAIPTVAGTVDGMVTQKTALSRVARASHNLQQYLPDHVRGDIQFQSSAASDEAATWTEFCGTLEEQHLSIYNTTHEKEEQAPVKKPAKQGTVASLGEENVAPNTNTKHQTTTTVKPAPSQTEGTKPTVPEASKEEGSQPTATSGNRNETGSKGNQNKNTADDVTTPVRKKATKLPPESQPMPQPVQTPQPFKKTANKSPIPEDVPTTPGSSKHRRTSSRFPIPPCNNNHFTTGTSQAFTATVTSPLNGSSPNQKAASTKPADKETSPMSSWGFALPPGYEKNATSPRYSPTTEPTPTKRRKERAKPTHQFAASRNPPPKLKQPETQHSSGVFSTTSEARKESHNPFLSAATFQQSQHSSGSFGAPSEARKENPFFGAPKPTVAQQHAPMNHNTSATMSGSNVPGFFQQTRAAEASFGASAYSSRVPDLEAGLFQQTRSAETRASANSSRVPDLEEYPYPSRKSQNHVPTSHFDGATRTPRRRIVKAKKPDGFKHRAMPSPLSDDDL